MSSELYMIKANFVAIMVGRRQKAKEETFEIIGVHIIFWTMMGASFVNIHHFPLTMR